MNDGEKVKFKKLFDERGTVCLDKLEITYVVLREIIISNAASKASKSYW